LIYKSCSHQKINNIFNNKIINKNLNNNKKTKFHKMIKKRDLVVKKNIFKSNNNKLLAQLIDKMVKIVKLKEIIVKTINLIIAKVINLKIINLN